MSKPNLVIVNPGERIYCPFHKEWETLLGETGEDSTRLCEWCCQPFPCPMHGDGSLPSMEDGEFGSVEAEIVDAKSRHPASMGRRPRDSERGVEFYIDISEG